MEHGKRSALRMVSGAAIAIAAAQLFSIGANMAVAADKTAAKVHCTAVNACKGQSECSSAKNGCKGQNECKGQGWVSMTEKECTSKGGKPDKN